MAEGSLSLFLLLLFWLRVHVIGLNLIAFIISVETEALLLAQQQKQQKQQKLQQQKKNEGLLTRFFTLSVFEVDSL